MSKKIWPRLSSSFCRQPNQNLVLIFTFSSFRRVSLHGGGGDREQKKECHKIHAEKKKVWKVCRKSLLWCMMASKRRRRRRKSYTKKTQILSAWSIGSRHIVWKTPKMSPMNFSILAFSTDFCPIKIDLSLRSPCWMRLLGRFSTTVIESKRSCYALLYPPGPMCRCQ